MERLLTAIRAFDGVLELAPGPGSEAPSVAWGDHFFYYSPDGTVPQNRQPYATIVTKDYPGDAESRLDAADRWRLNIHVGSALFTELIGEAPRSFGARDFSEADVVLPHPVYGSLGWIAVVNPHRTTTTCLRLLHAAHNADRRRMERRSSRAEQDVGAE